MVARDGATALLESKWAMFNAVELAHLLPRAELSLAVDALESHVGAVTSFLHCQIYVRCVAHGG